MAVRKRLHCEMEVDLLWLTLALTTLLQVCFSAYPQRQTPKEQGKGRNMYREGTMKGKELGR